MAAVKDIETNRTFLDTNFEGYKLNPSQLRLQTVHISEGVDIARPSDEQYSFLQLREFSLHNHLYNDPWNPAIVYVVSSDHAIRKFILNEVSGVITGPGVVWKIPFDNGRVKGHSNVSICFVAVNTVVISDGAGSLYVLTTGDRNLSSESWKVVHCEAVPDSIRLADARSPAPNKIHCLLSHVDTKQTYLTYLHLVCDNDAWKTKDSNIMFGKGSMDYAALRSDCLAAYVIGQVEFKTQQIIDEENLNSTEKKVTSFEWQQNYEELKLWINVANGDNPSVNISSTKLEVKTHEGGLLLNGTFYGPIEHGLSVWNIKDKNNKRILEIIISKRDEGSMWQRIFESSDFEGQEICDPNIAAMVHSNLSHLTSETEEAGGSTILNSGQLEECDVSECDRRLLVYYDISTPNITPTAKFELGIGQWLMSGPRDVEQPPKFCLRSDVDGIVWSIEKASPEHLATFCAFGFVQASKATRVFSFFPSDLSYAGLVDANGRVFVYCNGIRPGNSSAWGSQYIVSTLKSKVVGVHAIKSHIFILSDSDLHVIHLDCPI